MNTDKRMIGMETDKKSKKKSRRLVSLDVLRGITVAGMILVNNGYGESFDMLRHSAWNGMTACDLVFPFFLFIMGVSTFLSLQKCDFRLSAAVARKIVKRTVLIFLIGLGINYLETVLGGSWSVAHLRVMAVLQRIALCYCAVSFFALLVDHRYVLPAAIAILAVYTVILLMGNGYAEDGSNIAARIDNAVLGYDHLYHKSAVDPEGLLGTLPAIAHTLIGFYCGKLLFRSSLPAPRSSKSAPRSPKSAPRSPLPAPRSSNIPPFASLLLVGGILMLLGFLLQFGLPLNKRIWSPSYVLATCGMAATLQGILIYYIDVRGAARWIAPFLVFGVNPLFLYVLSEVLAIVCGHTGVNDWLFVGIHSVVSAPRWASLVYALVYVSVCGMVGWPLYKRRIYIKI